MATVNHQYEPPKMPSKWTGEEKKFFTRVIDIFDDIYSKWGRLSLNDLSLKARSLITSKVDPEQMADYVETAIEQAEDRFVAKAVRVGSEGETSSVEAEINPEHFQVRVNGEAELNIDETGVSAARITSPTVVQRYAGPETIRVNPSLVGQGEEYVMGLSDALAMLRERYIDRNISIVMYVDVFGDHELYQMGGTGALDINLNGHKIYGAFKVEQCDAPMSIHDGEINYHGSGAAFHVSRSKAMNEAYGMTIITDSDDAVYVTMGGWLFIHDSVIDSSGMRSLFGAYNTRIYGTNLTGKGNIQSGNGSILQLAGKIPAYNAATPLPPRVFSGSLYVGDNLVPTDAGGDTPEVTQTITLAATATDSARGSHGQSRTSSWTDANRLNVYQGYSESFNQMKGMIWFNMESLRTALAGRTIRSAKLTMKRTTGAGNNVAIQPVARIMTLSENYVGNVEHGTGFVEGVSQTLTGAFYEDTMEYELSAAFAAALTDGSATGIMLYNGEASARPGWNFSRNYGSFYGYGTGYAPTLTVVYQ